jgi:hypothetical protein
MSKDTDEVMAIERSLWTNANDPRVYEQTMIDGAISVIEPMGFIEKAQAIAYSAKGKPFNGVHMKDVVMREITPECIVLAYHGEATHVGEDKPYRGSISSVYVKKDGRWQLAMTAHQPWQPSGANGEGKSS